MDAMNVGIRPLLETGGGLGPLLRIAHQNFHDPSIVVAGSNESRSSARSGPPCRFSVATRDEAPFRAAGIAVINPWTAAPGAE
jgi:hypothetical protein